MKVITLNDLKTMTHEAPFYGVVKSYENRHRALGCGTLAFLNLVLLLRRQLVVEDERTAYQVVSDNLDYLKENSDLSINFESAIDFLDTNPFFNGFRMLWLNPNGMVADVFLSIALRRLSQGEVALLIVEARTDGEKARGQANHLAVLHSEDGDIFLDGLRIDMEAFINIAYFSSVNSLLFFTKNKGV